MPRQQYYLDPFLDAPIAATDSGKGRYVAKQNCTILNGLTDLPHIETTSTLLIDGHSARGLDVLANAYAHATRTFSGLQLALLLRDRLKTQHRKIRLLACHGGSALAPNLARWLHLFGYNQVAVGGYMYSIWQEAGHRSLIDDGVNMPWENYTNSGAVRWYGNQGQQVQKPVVQSDPQAYNPAFPT